MGLKDLSLNRLLSLSPLAQAAWFDAERSAVRAFVTEISEKVPAGSTVLDAGASGCQYKPLFADTRYVACDIRQPSPQGTIFVSKLDVLSDVAHLAFRDEVFDAVILTEVLEHVLSPQAVVREAYRVLQSGGRLFLSVPFAWKEHMIPHDYFRFTSSGLRLLLEQAGFEVLQLKHRGGYFQFIGYWLAELPERLFPPAQSNLERFVRLPLKAPAVVVFRVLVPFLAQYLDCFDRQRDLTLGFVCSCRKPTGGSMHAVRG